VAYTLTGAEFRNSFQSQYAPWGNVEVGDTLPYVPRHQFHASAEVEQPVWRARLTATYVGRMRTVAGQGAFVPSRSTDAHLVLGLSGEYTLTQGARLFASVQNLADQTYIVARHPAGVRPGLPRLVTVGLRIDLRRQ
jgi:Fe(3+) dicitrate transport protein